MSMQIIGGPCESWAEANGELVTHMAEHVLEQDGAS